MSRYRVVGAPHHPRAHRSARTKSPWLQEHIIVAERALGKYLPLGAEVHHVDEDKRNNTPSNLVICQDGAYHKLLHARARIVRAGGDPNTQRICGACREIKALSDFNKLKGGYQRRCRLCSRAGFKAWWVSKRGTAA